MEPIILSQKALDLLEEVYINNLETALVGASRKKPEEVLERVDTSIEVIEFIGALAGYFGKLKTDKIEIFVNDRDY